MDIKNSSLRWFLHFLCWCFINFILGAPHFAMQYLYIIHLDIVSHKAHCVLWQCNTQNIYKKIRCVADESTVGRRHDCTQLLIFSLHNYIAAGDNKSSTVVCNHKSNEAKIRRSFLLPFCEQFDTFLILLCTDFLLWQPCRMLRADNHS